MKLILRDQLNEPPLLGRQSNKDAHELTVACERQARTSLHASHWRGEQHRDFSDEKDTFH